MSDIINTVYGCISITKETVTIDEIAKDYYTIVTAEAEAFQIPQNLTGGINSDIRDRITEITGDPISSIKHEKFCEDEDNKEFVVYTTASEE